MYNSVIAAAVNLPPYTIHNSVVLDYCGLAHLFHLALIMLIRFLWASLRLWPRSQNFATPPKFLNSRSVVTVVCPTTNMLISPTTSAAEFRMRFKLAYLTYKDLSTIKPTYLHVLLTRYTLLAIIRHMSISWATIQNSYGSRAFPLSAPREWNRLPLSLRISNFLPSFKKRLKTHYFF